jgi:hypothetical protein
MKPLRAWLAFAACLAIAAAGLALLCIGFPLMVVVVRHARTHAHARACTRTHA